MKVRIIPENAQDDHYLLKPIFEGMFRFLSKPRTRIEIHYPRVKGFQAVSKFAHIAEVVDKFKTTVDLIVLCVDRDGEDHRREKLDSLEARVEKQLVPPPYFLAVDAWQELEVWALAGVGWKSLMPSWTWKAVREDRDPKEHYFEPLVRARGLADSAGRGRKVLGEEAGRNYAKVRQNCPEIRRLEERIRQCLHTANPT
jgi:hypothetical protein